MRITGDVLERPRARPVAATLALPAAPNAFPRPMRRRPDRESALPLRAGGDVSAPTISAFRQARQRALLAGAVATAAGHAILFTAFALAAILTPAVKEAEILFDPGDSVIEITALPSLASNGDPTPAAPLPTPALKPLRPDSALAELRRKASCETSSVADAPSLLAAESANAAVASLSPPAARPAPSPTRTAVQPGPPAPPTETPGARSAASDADLRTKGVRVAAAVRGVPKPEYPRLSRERGEAGTVLCSVEILPDGGCGAASVRTSSGYPALDRAALAALRRGSFSPMTIDGRPVVSVREVRFVFRLEDADR